MINPAKIPKTQIIAHITFTVTLSILLLQSAVWGVYPASRSTLSYLQTGKIAPIISLYTQSELLHLRDIRKLLNLNLVICLVTFLILFLGRHSRTLKPALISGAILCLSLTALLLLFLFISWNSLFITFHEVLFPQGNWAFPPDSTLIRLFPESFWFALFLSFPLLISLLSILVILFLRFPHSFPHTPGV